MAADAPFERCCSCAAVIPVSVFNEKNGRRMWRSALWEGRLKPEFRERAKLARRREKKGASVALKTPPCPRSPWNVLKHVPWLLVPLPRIAERMSGSTYQMQPNDYIIPNPRPDFPGPQPIPKPPPAASRMARSGCIAPGLSAGFLIPALAYMVGPGRLARRCAGPSILSG